MPRATPEEIAAARASLAVPDVCIPQSVAIIMDGNGRWAKQRDWPRPLGHQEGAKVVRQIVTAAAQLGLDSLSLYSFSQQNWNRPPEEVDALMHLYAEYLVHERETIMENNIRLRHLGQREGLPQMVLDELDESVRVSASNTGMYLCLALNYGAREEILHAAQTLAREVQQGKIDASDIDAARFTNTLDTCGVPDPDLLIRTAGEMRISNYLLWQVSYAEFYVTEKYWPDFTEADLHEAIRAYAKRDRRFGRLTETP